MAAPAAPLRQTVPNYSLYGESPAASLAGPIHAESIASRSRLHEWEIRSHRHQSFFQILNIRSGSARVLANDHWVDLTAPSVVTVPALIVHGFVFSTDVDGTVFTLLQHELGVCGLAPELCTRLGAQTRVWPLPARSRTNRSGVAARIDGLFTLLAQEVARSDPHRLVSIRCLIALTMIQLARLEALAAPAGAAEDSRKMRHLQRFIGLVDASFREQHGIAVYAQKIGITPTQLNRICRELLGLSALGVVQRRRLQEAQRELVYTALDVKEVAYALGFADPAYFTRFFVRQFGRTPTQFRADARHRNRTTRETGP